MPNTSSEDARKLEAQKNTCKECAKAGRSPKEACPHKGQDNAAGSEETAAASEAKKDEPKSVGVSGSEHRHDKPAVFADFVSVKYSGDSATLTLTPKDPSTGPAFGNKLIKAWEDFRKQYDFLKDDKYNIRETFDSKGNKTIAFTVPSELFNKFIQSLADKGIINQNSATKAQQEHIENLKNGAKLDNATDNYPRPDRRLRNPFASPKLTPPGTS